MHLFLVINNATTKVSRNVPGKSWESITSEWESTDSTKCFLTLGSAIETKEKTDVV